MKRNKNKFQCLFFSILFIFIFLSSINSTYAATPKIIDKMSSAFEDIEKWLIKLSTPAAAVAIAVGLFMKKFSFGDEERIRSAKRIIRSSFISYAMLLAIDLILSAIKSLVN